MKNEIPTDGIAKSLTAAAKALKLTPRTLRDLKAENFPGIRPDGTVDLAVFAVAWKQRKKKQTGSVDLKGRKTKEEIRKLKLANDLKAGLLIERSWMAERIHAAAGKVDGFRQKSEAEHPLLFAAAAGDVPKCREVVRKIWDEIILAMASLATEFDKGESRKGTND